MNIRFIIPIFMLWHFVSLNLVGMEQELTQGEQLAQNRALTKEYKKHSARTLEDVKACLEAIDHTVVHHPETLRVLCAKVLQKHPPERGVEEKAPQDVRGALHAPFLQENAVAFHKICNTGCLAQRESLPCMPEVIVDPMGTYLLAKSNTEFYLYALTNVGLRLILHELSPCAVSSNFAFLMFYQKKELMLFNRSTQTITATGISEIEFQKIMPRRSIRSVELSQAGEALLREAEGNSALGSFLFFPLRAEEAAEEILKNARGATRLSEEEVAQLKQEQLKIAVTIKKMTGYTQPELSWVPALQQQPIKKIIADIGTVSSYHRDYETLMFKILSLYLYKEKKIKPACSTLTPDGRFFAYTEKPDRSNKYITVGRIDLANLDATTSWLSFKLLVEEPSHLTISKDGTFCLLVLKTGEECKEWRPLSKTQKPWRCLTEHKLLLVNVETGESVCVMEKNRIAHCGFIRSADCFYVWDCFSNFYIYDLKVLSTAFTSSQLAKIIALQKQQVSHVNGRPLIPARTLSFPFTINDGEELKTFEAHHYLGIESIATKEEIDHAYQSITKSILKEKDRWFTTARHGWVERELTEAIAKYRLKYFVEKENQKDILEREFASHEEYYTTTVHEVLALLKAAYTTMLKNRGEPSHDRETTPTITDEPIEKPLHTEIANREAADAAALLVRKQAVLEALVRYFNVSVDSLL